MRRFYDHTFEKYDMIVTTGDLASLPYCKKGWCSNIFADDKLTLKVLLYLLGMDISKPFEPTLLVDDVYEVIEETGERILVETNAVTSYRSWYTDEVQHGGLVYVGYKRKDYNSKVAAEILGSDEKIKKIRRMILKQEKKKNANN